MACSESSDCHRITFRDVMLETDAMQVLKVLVSPLR